MSVEPEQARQIVEGIPYWLHTFALNPRYRIYTPGRSRSNTHPAREQVLPQSFAGQTVLDVGTHDGFYAFVAERRGAARTTAIDSEVYVDWLGRTENVELVGGAAFQAIGSCLQSRVEYARVDVRELSGLGREFDCVLCLGVLHWIDDVATALSAMRSALTPGGKVLVDAYGGAHGPATLRTVERKIYRGARKYSWRFSVAALNRLARDAGFASFQLLASPIVDGHPRLYGWMRNERVSV